MDLKHIGWYDSAVIGGDMGKSLRN